MTKDRIQDLDLHLTSIKLELRSLHKAETTSIKEITRLKTDHDKVSPFPLEQKKEKPDCLTHLPSYRIWESTIISWHDKSSTATWTCPDLPRQLLAFCAPLFTVWNCHWECVTQYPLYPGAACEDFWPMKCQQKQNWSPQGQNFKEQVVKRVNFMVHELYLNKDGREGGRKEKWKEGRKGERDWGREVIRIKNKNKKQPAEFWTLFFLPESRSLESPRR